MPLVGEPNMTLRRKIKNGKVLLDDLRG